MKVVKILLYYDRVENVCPYRIAVPSVGQSEMAAWCNDPSRPGYYHLDTAWNLDSLSDDDEDEYLVMALHVSDPDVAFEARMRWA